VDVELSSLPEGITILTGGRGSGKTRTCQRLVEQAGRAGWSVGGLLCPAVFERREKTGIDVINLKTGERRHLALHVNRQTGFEVTDHWDFSEDAMTWSNEILGEKTPCDLFIVDELGPLEFNRRQGWVNAFDALGSAFFLRAVVVIRPELLGEAFKLWPAARIINLDS
jgi:nucleoside-triphosphatase THEP1